VALSAAGIDVVAAGAAVLEPSTMLEVVPGTVSSCTGGKVVSPTLDRVCDRISSQIGPPLRRGILEIVAEGDPNARVELR